MDSHFQMVFYAYMSFLGTVVPPLSVVWLVLRQLGDELHDVATHDSLTRLLDRHGLVTALQAHFRSPTAQPARLLMLDIDHFKCINDTHGHQTGDLGCAASAKCSKIPHTRQV